MKTFEGANRTMMPNGIPMKANLVNQPPRPAVNSNQIPPQLLATLIVCLLENRGENSELGQAFCKLVEERHNEFHAKRNVSDWKKCDNPVCCAAASLLEHSNKPDVTFGTFTIQRVMKKGIKVQGGNGGLRVYTVEETNEAKPDIVVVPG